jgi:hypothetical protein
MTLACPKQINIQEKEKEADRRIKYKKNWSP